MELLLETLLILAALASFLFITLNPFLFKLKHDFLFALTGISALGGWMVLRVFVVRHAPFSSAYESMLFFALIYAFKILLLTRFQAKTKGLLMIPAEMMMIAAVLFPLELKAPQVLTTALDSVWIFIHVPLIFLGYVSMTMGFVLALCIRFGKGGLSELLEREMQYAFFFTACGIVTGGFWAQLTWGSFWSWDPKETFALITWIFIGLERHFKKRSFRRIFIYAAFSAMLFTYFGVMFLLPGLHSYR